MTRRPCTHHCGHISLVLAWPRTGSSLPHMISLVLVWPRAGSISATHSRGHADVATYVGRGRPCPSAAQAALLSRVPTPGS
jgi:hypothetical protein